MKIRLTIAFDGTAYAGWQIQKSGVGVQQKVEEALGRLFPSRPRLHSSSRTDAGVHALAMIAHFEIPPREFRMKPSKLVLAANAYLPQDIRVQAAVRCPARFHARFDAVGKQYRYFIWNRVANNPLLRHQAWHIAQKLNLTAMRQAAADLVGKHDFKSFAASRSYEPIDTVRELYRCDIQRRGQLLTVVIEGNGFLYKMCRGIVGTLVQIGQGKIEPASLASMLASKDRRVAGMTAPAHGLTLWKVYYRAHRAR